MHIESSENGTVVVKYGQEILLETNLQLQQSNQSVAPQNQNSQAITTIESPNSQTIAQSNPETKPPTPSKNKSAPDIFIPLSKETPNARDSVNDLPAILRDLLASNRFNEEDLKDICHDLIGQEPVYQEIINYKNNRAMARRLIEYLQSRVRLNDLVNYIKKTRHDIII
nr:hypothetical protein [Dendronalium sp. ChiSLP03b]